MKQSLAWGNAALALTLLLSLAGCKKSLPTPATDNQTTPAPPQTPIVQSPAKLNPITDLRYLGLHLQKHGKGGRLPAKLDELTELKRELPQVYQAIQDGAYVVSWGIPQTTEAIVAYERDVPSKGGTVLVGDGSVRVLSAEEFRIDSKGGN
jgi:hypothetical protein